MILYVTKFFKLSAGSFILTSFLSHNFLSINSVKDIKVMEPHLNPNISEEQANTNPKLDFILNYRGISGQKWTSIKKNKLVQLHHPFEDRKAIRFLVALPGEWIKQRDTNIFHRVPEGHCWVESISGEDDSSSWGPIPLPLILGQPIILFRPPFKKMIWVNKINRKLESKLNCAERTVNDDSHFFS
jgi:hypothetical protein